jgi:DNA-binding NtrC family response regulator
MNTTEQIERKGRVLIVDDETVVQEALTNWFRHKGFDVQVAHGAYEALEKARGGDLDLALLDIKMPGMDGMDLMSRLQQLDPNLMLVMMTGHASVETAVRALKCGAYDYLTKPFDPQDLMRLALGAVEQRRAKQEEVLVRDPRQEASARAELVGKSASIRRVREAIQTVGAADSNVLIAGESGTGKELVARAIHAAGPHGAAPMAMIHCGALTETLLESELFGHERGAFRGAQQSKKGKFELAGGGTVFLDEISDISLRMQAGLLRVLQEKQIVRVGGDQPIPVTFRCIAATNRDLQDLVDAGSFRADLFYRLNAVLIELAPLRERRDDIPLLANHFVERFAASMSRPAPRISPAAMELLINYSWPGNVRELENAVERAMLVGQRAELEPADFPLPSQAAPPPEGRSLEDIERLHIERVLEETRWNLSRTARILGIDRTTLYNKLKRYGLKRQEFSGK